MCTYLSTKAVTGCQGAAPLGTLKGMDKLRRRGDEMTIESIVKKHGGRLFNLAYRICGDKFLAEDLLQESLLQIHRALPSFREESSA